MRVVCLVPSLTEILIECGIEVVGRTRYCIHPQSQVRNIKILGGTKDFNTDTLSELKADCLIMDREENTREMVFKTSQMKNPVPIIDTHVTSIKSLAGELQRLSDVLKNKKLAVLSSEAFKLSSKMKKDWNFEEIPGELARVGHRSKNIRRLVYVIWKNPWMCVSRQTYIGDVLCSLGAEDYLPLQIKNYQEFDLHDWASLSDTYFLFSSEPYPFLKKKSDLVRLGVSGSLVDGESYSWFGLRSMRFLQKHLQD